jgi:hypothetical protein
MLTLLLLLLLQASQALVVLCLAWILRQRGRGTQQTQKALLLLLV